MSSTAPSTFAVVLFGATGTAGSGALQACLADRRVTEIRAVTRRALPFTHHKVREIRCGDFADLAPIADGFRAVDVCLFCLGTSVRNVAGESEYRTIHVEYPLAAARALLAQSPGAAFVYLSGGGTARDSRMMWARAKAEALGRAMLAAARDPSSAARVTLENRALRALGADSPRAT